MQAQPDAVLDRFWTGDALDFLTRFIRIPNVSPAFDPEWERKGHMAEAVELARRWSAARPLAGVEIALERSAGITPALLVRVQGSGTGQVLLYGHLDKQPEFTGWHPGFGPWQPVVRDGRLFGRGSVDDGYALCVALGALESLQREGRAHPTCTILLECGEESGSRDLPHHLSGFADAIGTPDMVVALDSEAGDYERMWTTRSLRGVIVGTLSVRMLTEGVHSGAAGGVVPDTFRVLRCLLDRIDDPVTGCVRGMLDAPVPEAALNEAASTARVLGRTIIDKFPWAGRARPLSEDPATLLVNNTWRSCVTVTGAGGLPDFEAASNTHRPYTALKLSIRIPPSLDAQVVAVALKRALEEDPPHAAQVAFSIESVAEAWSARQAPPWLADSVQRASLASFGHAAESMGTGGTIPFVQMLGSRFPQAAFLVTGVAGPRCNAHGPNEFLHLGAVRNLTACLASILADAAGRLGLRERRSATTPA